MNSRDILNLAVRLLGLVFLFLALESLPRNVIGVFSGFIDGILTLAVTTGWYSVVAFWLMRGAPALMALVHPQAEPSAK